MDLIEVGNQASQIQLVRCGKASAPLDWPSPGTLKLPARDRFDDPGRRYRVLYAAETPRGALLEWLASFRVSMKTLAKLGAIELNEPHPTSGALTRQDLKERRLGTFTVQQTPSLKFLDVREPATIAQLRVVLASTFLNMGVDEVEPSELLGRNRGLTQAIGGWAYEQGYNGVVYLSRYDPRLSNWALFDSLHINPIGERDIAPDDPDLIAALRQHRLRLLPSR